MAGFYLYQEGVRVCTFDPGVSTGTCHVVLTKKVTAFTLTAFFVDNTESSHLASFSFTNVDFPDLKYIGVGFN